MPCWHVLVVDDDVAFTELVSRQLAKHGCTVHGVQTCTEALDYIEINVVDCVLMDQRLAGQRSGTECVKEIRTANYLGSVIILTGFPDERDIITAIHAGADDYLDKGKMLGLLYTSIKGAIEIRVESSKLGVKHQIRQAEIERIRGLLREATAKLDYISSKD